MSRSKRRRKRKSRFLLHMMLSLSAFSIFSVYKSPRLVGFVNPIIPSETAKVVQPIETSPVPDEQLVNLVDLSQAKSPNIILLDYRTGQPLAEKASDATIFPASLTKIMTVAVALDHLTDLDQKVVMEEIYFEGLFEARASITGLVEEEITTVKDLLYGAILPSGADACLALADLVAGSESAFVELMNQKAAELNMTETHYANATGLHDVKNVSSVENIAKLTLAALENPIFYEIFTTLQYEVSPTNVNENGFLMNSTIFNPLLKYPELNGVVIGGKTGFTEQAGLCMASIGEIDGEKYLLVTAGADAIPDFPIDQDRHIEEPLHVQDAAFIYRQLRESMNDVPDNRTDS